MPNRTYILFETPATAPSRHHPRFVTGGAQVGRPKKFQKPRNISFTMETADHQALRRRAFEKGKSLSDLIRTLALKEIQKK